MTNLRVFEDPQKRLLIEISSPTSVLSRGLFVPALRLNEPVSALLNRSEVVDVRLGDEVLRIPFLVVLNRQREKFERFHLVGQLEETDSLNIINHVLDILAWP